ncbi:MAG: bifunctional proline dehydrogenase/L-glutamate gamma-semialdehyde dehydrogenase PutA [Dongiaceae bacterium]
MSPSPLELLEEKAYQRLNAYYREDEEKSAARLLKNLRWDEAAQKKAAARAEIWVKNLRGSSHKIAGIEAFLQEYQLNSDEGIALMCLAEALLRIPDTATRDALIRDKIGARDWHKRGHHAEGLFVNAASWGLLITGKVVNFTHSENFLGNLIARLGEPVIRTALKHAMKMMGEQFVLGRDIEEALANAPPPWRYSFDMLGEAAKTRIDAKRYLAAYHHAIQKLSAQNPITGNGISVKLSALHPRYDITNYAAVKAELGPDLLGLAEAAKAANISLCIDAEESERLDLSLDLVAATRYAPSLQGWDGLGLAVQAYQKRALGVVEWAENLAALSKHRLMVRLVKGAYWDSEIKRAQERGLKGYEVYTRKNTTDVSYLACAQKLLAAKNIYPQFGTHNAHTIAAVLEFAGNGRDFEFQRLHGMAEGLYEQVLGEDSALKCRVYAPVGSHEDLLPYLVRRLLENGANANFMHQLLDKNLPIAQLLEDPAAKLAAQTPKANPRISLPASILAPRQNSLGHDWSDLSATKNLAAGIEMFLHQKWLAAPLIDGVKQMQGEAEPVTNPANRYDVVGRVYEALTGQVLTAIEVAKNSFPKWQATSVEIRAECLRRAAGLLEENRAELMALCVREAGKTLPDALAEVREAVDFCRYYADQAEKSFTPLLLPGPTGEKNELRLEGRGVFACISPWNFPLAIFLGQVTAALVAGNCVIAKPAEQTPLIAMRAVELLHQAGIPKAVVQLLPGTGEVVGGQLVSHPAIAGVAFTGGTDTARRINQAIAAKEGPIIPFIAETGGLNAMIVDSSALPEQVVNDVIVSAFQSAGQRCSALRLLCVQEDAADKIIAMLTGAMDELRVGDPRYLDHDIGPVIDKGAKDILEAHVQDMLASGQARLLYQASIPQDVQASFFPPTILGIDSPHLVKKEVFGPILHVARFAADEIEQVIAAINRAGYGLTFGLHTRIQETVDKIVPQVRAGNCYINRNMIGAVVGVQPFGGQGLSGTGPKAGGPHYLLRFANERTVTVDTTASGGNASLLAEMG